MHTLEKLRDMLMEELDRCAEKDGISNNGLYAIDKLTHAVKSIDTILAMEDAGYSNDNYSYARGRRGNVRRDSMGRYSRGNSYRGYSRDNMGYSRDDAKDDLVEQLREMSTSAEGEHKQMIDNWIRQVEQS